LADERDARANERDRLADERDRVNDPQRLADEPYRVTHPQRPPGDHDRAAERLAGERDRLDDELLAGERDRMDQEMLGRVPHQRVGGQVRGRDASPLPQPQRPATPDRTRAEQPPPRRSCRSTDDPGS
ncbi:MAG TPA: hypothetical protein VF755_22490, partial [Catenuloplanes sp.]